MSADTGNLLGTVADSKGKALPGATVILTPGSGPPRVEGTNAEGKFGFLNLPPWKYDVRVELEGYSPAEYSPVQVHVGRNTELDVTLLPAVSQ